MNYWHFTSVNNWFSLTLPENWSEYDDEDGTAAFFNKEKWSGNLRITAVRITNIEADKISSFAQSKTGDDPNAILVKLGNWDTVFYSEKSTDGCIVYYWTMGSSNFWFVCSFTIDDEFFDTERNIKELDVVEEIISSIKILN